MRTRSLARMALVTALAVAGAVAVGVSLERGESLAQKRPTPPSAAAAVPPSTPPAPPQATVLTFNAGLVIGVLPLARERVPLVADQLAKEPADLVCAQELWLEPQWRAVADALAPRLPHTHRPPAATPGADEACSADDIAPLEACHRASCARARPAELASCMIGRCAHLVTAIDAGCVSCLLREPWSSIAAVREACTAASPSLPRPTPARRVGPALAFGGSGGVGILSRWPIADRDTLVLPSSWNRRVVLYGRIEPPGLGPLHVFCTHLSAQLGAIAPPGGKSWEQEQAEQVRDLLTFVDRKVARGEGTVILAGDLNTGPGLPGRASAKLPAHYQRLLSAGFDDPYAAQPDARCTYCFDNPLVGRAAGGLIIDHVLLRGWTGSARARRVLDRALPIEVDGRPRTTPPSDHYGLSVTLSR